jgi:glycerol-3-phosphate acyltransferase PlsY
MAVMTALIFTIIGYLSGSLPFSIWLGRLAFGVDIRRVGADHNPGAANVFKVGGKRKWWVGMAAILADGLKGLIPVAIALYNFDVSGWGLVPVAVAPVAGHAFSIFLKFKGGKALATTFGIWTALTVWPGPLVLGFFFALFYIILTNNAWAAILGMLGLAGYLLLSHASPIFLAIWVLNFAIMLWKHRTELRQPVRLNTFSGRSRSQSSE